MVYVIHHIIESCLVDTEKNIRLPQCQWSNPEVFRSTSHFKQSAIVIKRKEKQRKTKQNSLPIL